MPHLSDESPDIFSAACITRCVMSVSVLLWLSPNTNAQNVSFNRDIRPILSENCFHCHGPDADARQADLRLDTFEGATEFAMVPGEPTDSELYDRVISDDPDAVMPPPDSERSLTDQQKELLRRWIEQGGQYQSHWSFIAPVATVAPKAIEGFGDHGPIDRFVHRRIHESNFQPAKPADRETLVRRISFDLTGLPPTIEQIDRFLRDDSPDAIERLIDRLMADPRFGERMAADWLDVARYSDTYGYQVDRDRFVWPWRDWVVSALNRNLPYDQFMTEQLAGDLLQDASRDQILATAFNRLHPQKVEGGSVPEEFRIEYVADRTQTVGTAFMGLTLECCRCHNHKYDPITQSEYYQLSAYFANIDEAGLYSYFTPSVPTPTLPLPTEAQERQLQIFRREVDRAQQVANRVEKIDEAETSGIDDFDRESFRKKSGTPKQLGDADEAASNDGKVVVEDNLFAKSILNLDFETVVKAPNQSVDGVVGKAILLTGDDAVNTKVGNFRRDQPFSVSLWIKTPDVKERAVVFHRSRAWTDAASRGYQLLIEDGRLSWSLIHFWPGNAIRIRTVDPISVDEWLHVVVTNNGSSTAAGLAIYLDGKRCPTEVVRDNLTKQITGGGGDHIAIGQRFRDRGFTKGAVDQFAVYDTLLTELEVRRLSQPTTSLDWVDRSSKTWTPQQRNLIRRHLRWRHNDNVNEANAKLQTARRKWFALQDKLQEIMVMQEAPNHRVSYRLDRGAYDNRAEPVEPGTPKAITASVPLEDLSRDRLQLARWLSDPRHPLSSRVAVNRLWQLCFGVGLVRTPEDFGSQGAPPTHPELLDWLAVDFVEHGWDGKRTLKQIMLSATYQQASEHDDERLFREDPENRLLARQQAYRLSAEMLRDQALALSGNLDGRMGGPPVKPYEVEASFKPTQKGSGADLYRRSLYTYWKRTGPAPAMMALDASKRDVCRMQRERTSSPLQAFVLMNGPQYVEASRGIALRVLRKHRNDAPNPLVENTDSMLKDGFRMLTSRDASASELAVLRELYDQQHAYFLGDQNRVHEYLAVGEMPTDRSFDAAQTAALSVVFATLMNFDESVMKR